MTGQHAAGAVRVELGTPYGPVVVELEAQRAPVTAANFLRYVDQRSFESGSFYRVVRPDNDHGSGMQVVQGGLGLTGRPPAHPAIEHESTGVTGITHQAGTISMARLEPGTASSEFFICLAPAPMLDHGSSRGDGFGFAAFGRVVDGLEVLAHIHGLTTDEDAPVEALRGQLLSEPVVISHARRQVSPGSSA